MIAKKKLLETIIDIDKLANIILVKEASLNQGQVEQEEQVISIIIVEHLILEILSLSGFVALTFFTLKRPFSFINEL